MNIDLVPQMVALLASVVFGLLPLVRARVRATWANVTFPVVGLIGVSLASVRLLGLNPAREFPQARPMFCGFALGLIVALILSRQLLGQKRHSNANPVS